MSQRTTQPPLAAPADHSLMAGRLCILVCALLWSTNGLFAKAPIFDDWPQATRGINLAFWRALFAGLLVLPMVRRPQWHRLLVPMALCFAVMNVLFLQAMTLTTAANAIWLQSTSPLWVFVLSLLLRQDPFDRRNLLPLVLGAVGVGLILTFELQQQDLSGFSMAGVICALIAGLGYAAVVMFMRALRAQEAAWLVVVNHLCTSLLLGPYLLVNGNTPSLLQLGVLMAFGLLQMGLPYLLFARGLRSVSSQEAAGIALIEPVAVPIWVFLAWGERPAWWTIAGGALILVGLVVRYARRSEAAKIERLPPVEQSR